MMRVHMLTFSRSEGNISKFPQQYNIGCAFIIYSFYGFEVYFLPDWLNNLYHEGIVCVLLPIEFHPLEIAC